MIQRIQSVYLLIAAVLMVVCACLPIGTIAPGAELGVPSTMYNIAIIDGNGTWDFTVCGLLVILACSAVSTAITIFNYNNRRAQSRSCLVNMILMCLWVGLYVVLGYIKGSNDNFDYSYTAILPIISFIFIFLARRGVIHDEKLIKSMDRIR